MSLHTLTVDQLMQLDKPTLSYALGVFQKELDGTLDLLTETPEARADEVVLSDLTNLLTLRKVFALRLEEMAADEAFEQQMLPSTAALAQAA